MDDALEAGIRERATAGDLHGAATSALEGYGSEILGYLVATCGDASVAEEVFSTMSEDLWKALPAFRWESSMRTWLYVLARNAHARYRRTPHEKRRANLSALGEVEAAIRTRTRPWLRTEVKDRFTALRDELDEGERSLLVLRVDRRMPWADIAQVLGEDDANAVPRIRKRFSLLKAKLHERARAAGLIDTDEG
ncbi:MAG: sigma-70 family RNA polymerase sigma factor [Sandaracinaceae bacterium]|nr:sigma-70 family RNA polymerase sigma factor [Sandaracinaceae bacterium]